jgi:elongation of very long chain fatty acids protein 4
MLFAAPISMLSITASYLVSIYLLQSYMQAKQAYSLKSLMLAYNLFQVLFNGYIVYGLNSLISFPNIFGLNTPYNERLEFFVYLHYISKYVDFFDTLFIILRKKQNQLSFLHIYHHSTIPIVWGSLLYIGHGNGTAAFGAWINSVIHVIMYSHYYYTSLGYNNPYKKYITQAQMGQFVLCLSHSMIVIAFENIVPKHLAITQTIYHMQMLYLFNKFYVKSY